MPINLQTYTVDRNGIIKVQGIAWELKYYRPGHIVTVRKNTVMNEDGQLVPVRRAGSFDEWEYEMNDGVAA